MCYICQLSGKLGQVVEPALLCPHPAVGQLFDSEVAWRTLGDVQGSLKKKNYMTIKFSIANFLASSSDSVTSKLILIVPVSPVESLNSERDAKAPDRYCHLFCVALVTVS